MLTDNLVRLVCIITMVINMCLFITMVIRLFKATSTTKYDDIIDRYANVITSIISTTKELNNVDLNLTKLSENNYLTLIELITFLHQKDIITDECLKSLMNTLNGQKSDTECKDIEH